MSSPGPGGRRGETPPSVEEEKPEVELNNLARSSELSQSQSSLRSSSSVGSVRGEDGGLYADFYGDYRPLLDHGQEAESASLRGRSRASRFLSDPSPRLLTTSSTGHPGGQEVMLRFPLQARPGAPPSRRQSWRGRAAWSWRGGG